MDRSRTYALATTDQLLKAAQYRPLIVRYRNGGAVRLGDVATVTDSVEDLRVGRLHQRQSAVLIIIFRQPGANIIDTVDRVYAAMPNLAAVIPPTIKLSRRAGPNTDHPRFRHRRAAHSADFDRPGHRWWCSSFCATGAPR